MTAPLKTIESPDGIAGQSLGAAPCSALACDPYETEEYQRFVSEMAQHCQCRANNSPCDGVLAGGPCDMLQEEQPHESFDDDE